MFKAISYPNNSDFLPTQPHYDLGKWMNAMKNIYLNTHLGSSRSDAIDATTKEWDHMEKVSFLDWMKYYESGDHKKYKTAQTQSYYVNDNIPNYFIPNPKNVPSPILNPADPNQELNEAQKKRIADEEKRKLIEDQRKKILGRLNSAEKLLSSHQGQIFAGPDFERLLISIYEIKKQIQTVNKMNVSAKTCVDLIIRQANILKRQGFNDASEIMVKFAQNTPGDFSLNMNDIPAGGSVPQAGSGLGNNPPSADALETPAPEGLDGDKENGIQSFLDNLEGGGIADVNEVSEEDEVEIGDDVFLDQEIMPDDELVVEAQALPEAPIAEPTAVPEAPEQLGAIPPADDVEVQPALNMTPEQVKAGPQVGGAKNDLDALIDSAFANITVDDIVDKLQSILKVFRTREIGRQLAIIDIMMNQLGIATYFPTLSECLTKNLESGTYVSTRLDDILSRLQGNLASDNIDLTNENGGPANPEGEKIRQSLEQSEQKDKQRKELRQQLQDKKLEDAVKPEAEVTAPEAELAAAPTQIEKPVVQPQAPVV